MINVTIVDIKYIRFMQNEGGLCMAIIVEQSKILTCHKCGSIIAVIASDVRDEEIRGVDGGKEVNRKSYVCPNCNHVNFLAEEDIPKYNADMIEDLQLCMCGNPPKGY